MATISMFHLVIVLLSCFFLQAQASGNNSSSVNSTSTPSVTPSATTSTIAVTASTTSTPAPTTTASVSNTAGGTVSATTGGATATTAATTTSGSPASTSIQASTTASTSSSSSVPTTQPTTAAPAPTYEAQVNVTMKVETPWDNDLNDLNSTKSIELIGKLRDSLKKINNDEKVELQNVTFRRGSVIANFIAIFKNIASGSNPVKRFQDAVKDGTFKVGNITVDANSLQVSVEYNGFTLIWKLESDVYLKECCKSHIGNAREKQECSTNTTTCAAVPKETRDIDCGEALKKSPPRCPSKACALTCISTAIMLLGVLASKIIF